MEINVGRVAVIGGGLVGLFTSYYLLREGVDVLLVDYDVMGVKASLWNAGFIVPSFAATPRLSLSLVLRALLGRGGPVSVSILRIFSNPGWFLEASRSTGRRDDIIRALSESSLELYRMFLQSEGVDVDMVEGVVAAFTSYDDASGFARTIGGKLLDSRELGELGYKSLGGGVLVEKELSVNPEKLYEAILDSVKRLGIDYREVQVTGLKPVNHRGWRLITTGEGFEVDFIVIAAGSESGDLCKSIGFNPRVEPARGLVALHTTKSKIVGAPAILEDYGIAIAQHGDKMLRITGFFDLVGHRTLWEKPRLEELLNIARAHILRYEDAKLETVRVGFRPCTSDMLPVIGEIPRRTGAYIATGHCRLGVTMAPITGHIITNMITNKPQTVPDEFIKILSPKGRVKDIPSK